MNDRSAHIRQPEIPALEFVGQLLVIDAHQVQHRRVQVVDVVDIFDGVVAQFVGAPVADAALDAAAGDRTWRSL